MYRIKQLIFFFVMLIVFSACTQTPVNNNDDKTKIVTTVFPLFDWTRNIVGDDQQIEIILLQDDAGDLHSYQPSAEDILNIINSDLFIYIGGESDEWVQDVLKSKPDLKTINVMEQIKDRLKQEELVEGMQSDEHEEEDEFDEHVWLSLRNASIICEKISDMLTDVCDRDFSLNLENYCAKLNDLDNKYETTVNTAVNRVLLFADRFPFRYLCDDYGISYYAAFKGCSAESEASFETIRFLSDKLIECNLPVVLCIEGSNQKIAETIIANTQGDRKICMMDSMQTTIDGDYLDIMTSNLEVLKTALN